MNLDTEKSNNIKDLQESLDDFLWSVTYRHPSGDVVQYSESLYSITGYTSAEIEEMPGRIISLVLEDDRDNVKLKLAELENNPTNNFARIIYRIRTKSNNIVWLKEKIKVARDDSGKIIKLNKIAVDISDLKEKESLLEEEVSKLKRLHTEKDKFISIISHDLRSPFTTLLGFTEILINEDSVSVEEQNEYLGYIYEASKTQLQMINNLLDWSRLQTGRVKIDPVRLNLRTVVSNCVSSLTGEIVRKDIDVNTEIDENLFIVADERYIDIAIRNLVSNAVKFSPNDSVIEISSNAFSEGKCELIFKDHGTGIPEREHSKLFKIDEKYVREGVNGEKGTGLGLTLVKEIIDKHEGKIWFYSQEGEGSEFHVVLNEAKNIILIIEDDKDTRYLYEKKFNELLPHYTVILSENGYSAMKILNDIVPTVIVTDHDMPLMNGIQFIEAIRNRDTFIPVIVISAIFNSEIKIKYEQLGIVDLLHKPIDYKDLVRRIAKNIK
ncbi:MAG: response regulator [Bacteroidetes bacterium]|nr:response regulator [Bacteroidota bacterium]